MFYQTLSFMNPTRCSFLMSDFSKKDNLGWLSENVLQVQWKAPIGHEIEQQTTAALLWKICSTSFNFQEIFMVFKHQIEQRSSIVGPFELLGILFTFLNCCQIFLFVFMLIWVNLLFYRRSQKSTKNQHTTTYYKKNISMCFVLFPSF